MSVKGPCPGTLGRRRRAATDFEDVLPSLEMDLLAGTQERDCPFEADSAFVRSRVGPADVVSSDEADRQVLQMARFPGDVANEVNT